jgi:hypothetical protein
MSDIYRFYRLDGVGHLHSADWFDAESDDAAIALIEAKCPDVQSEIWLGGRLVAKLSPSRQYA